MITIAGRGSYLTLRGKDELGNGTDFIPEGWKRQYAWIDSSGYVLPDVNYDSKTIENGLTIYDNVELNCSVLFCSVLHYSSVLSVSKMKSLGSTDTEVSQKIMNELVASTVDQVPSSVAFSQQLDPEGFVELQEYTYLDLSGKEYSYAIRGFASNGFVLVIANNCGFSNSDLDSEGLVMQVDVDVRYPAFGSERQQ